MGGISQYAGAVAVLSLMLIAIYAYPLITAPDSESGADGALESTILTSYSPTQAQRKEILNVEKTYEVVRGRNSSFEVSVSNPFKNSTILGLDLTLGGSFAKYLEVEPLGRTDARGEKIELLGGPGEVGLSYGETQTYEIKALVPQYVDRGTYFVDLEIHKGNVTYRDYPAIGTLATEKVLKYKDITFEIIEKRTVALNVHTFSEDEAGAAYEENVENIGLMRNAGFLTERVERLLDNARAEMSDGDYEEAIEIGGEISRIKEDAFSSRDEIEGLHEIIKDAEDVQGLKVPETKELLSLAIAAFEREDYEMARQRVRDGELVYASETRGKVNYGHVILNNIIAITLVAAAILAISIFTSRLGNLVITDRRLKGLDARDGNITELMKETQKGYYIDKTLGLASYKNAMAGFAKKLTENQSERARLKARRTGVLWHRENLERKNLEELIRDSQDRYYNQKVMSKSEYDRSMEHYLAMEADVEEATAVKELKVL